MIYRIFLNNDILVILRNPMRAHIYVNISPTLVIDASMERSSRVLHHGNPKIRFFFFFKKGLN